MWHGFGLRDIASIPTREVQEAEYSGGRHRRQNLPLLSYMCSRDLCLAVGTSTQVPTTKHQFLLLSTGPYCTTHVPTVQLKSLRMVSDFGASRMYLPGASRGRCTRGAASKPESGLGCHTCGTVSGFGFSRRFPSLEWGQGG